MITNPNFVGKISAYWFLGAISTNTGYDSVFPVCPREVAYFTGHGFVAPLGVDGTTTGTARHSSQRCRGARGLLRDRCGIPTRSETETVGSRTRRICDACRTSHYHFDDNGQNSQYRNQGTSTFVGQANPTMLRFDELEHDLASLIVVFRDCLPLPTLHGRQYRLSSNLLQRP